ncbi:MAG: bacterial Ig-like domain-containing protein [Clostridia bacterium]|nr:bacterial Ig-like domain-containing protein [Clostridia bacterium]
MKKAICLMLAAALVAALVPALMLTASAATDEFPLIESAPKNVCWPEGTMAAYQCVCSNDKGHEKFSYNWFITFDGKEYPIGVGSKSTDPWRKYVDFSGGMTGTIGNVLWLDKVQKGLDGSLMRCTVSSKTQSSTVYFRIMVGDSTMFSPPDITAPVFVTCDQGEDITLTVSGKPTSGNVTEIKDFITYQWYESPDYDIYNIKAIIDGDDTHNGKTYKPDTSEPGTYFYACGVFDGEGEPMANYSYSNMIIVEVLEKVENVSMEVTYMPNKTEYYVGESFDPKGMVVRVWRSDGYLDLKDGKDLKFEPVSFSKEGEQKVKLIYEDINTEITVKVVKKTVAPPKITEQPKGGTFKLGTECTLRVKAESSDGELSYQWYQQENGKEKTLIPDATAQIYIPPQTEGEISYSCVVSVTAGGAVVSEAESASAIVRYEAEETTAPDTTSPDTTAEDTPAATTGADATVPDTSEPAGTTGAQTADADGTGSDTFVPGDDKTSAIGGQDGKSSKAMIIVLASVAGAMVVGVGVTIAVLAAAAKKKKGVK